MYGTCPEEGEHNPERRSRKIAALSPGEEKLQASSKEEGHFSQPRGFRGIIVTGSQVSPARCVAMPSLRSHALPIIDLTLVLDSCCGCEVSHFVYSITLTLRSWPDLWPQIVKVSKYCHRSHLAPLSVGFPEPVISFFQSLVGI